jgi:hypothetical protein
MKKNLKYVFLTGLVALGVAAVSVYSCEKEVITPNSPENRSATVLPSGDICGKMVNKQLIRENGKVMGEALIYNDTKYFYVELTSQEKGYYFADAYMHIASKAEFMPVDKRGNVNISKFEYSITGRKLEETRKFRIPLTSLKSKAIVAVTAEAKHMNMGDNEHQEKLTVWIKGNEFGTGEIKGQMFKYQRQTCFTQDGEELTSEQ